MAGVKLVPFGQQAAQQLILRLCDHYAAEMPRALAAPDGDIGSATPLAAIASARHGKPNTLDYSVPRRSHELL